MVRPVVFDRAARVKSLTRVRQKLSDHDFLLRNISNNLSDRLNDLTRTFPLGVQIGMRAPLRSSKIQHMIGMDLAVLDNSPIPFVIGDEEWLPFQDASLDVVISNLGLHTTNDLPGALVQMRRALKPDGLFIAAMAGGETLRELRTSLMHAEIETRGGISPRVFPFADKQQMGGLMQRAGFALPVVDSEIITVHYTSLRRLMHDLRGMGENNVIAARTQNIPPRRMFDSAADFYKQNFTSDDGLLTASFEIIYASGWAPHESQQKPLRPGSAQNRLSDALGAIEIGTGEMPGG